MIPPLLRDADSVVSRGKRRARLRALLSDGGWHSTAELLRVAGSGVSSRLHELREGADGLPALDVEAEPLPGRGEGWRYRVHGEIVPGANLDGGAAEAADLAAACPALGDGACPRTCPSVAACERAGVRP